MSARLEVYGAGSKPSRQLRLSERLRSAAPDPWMLVGLSAFLALVFVALFGERIAPHEAIYFMVEHGSDPRPYDPGLVFPLGSDILGRDIFSLVLAGARTTLTIVVLGGLGRVIAGVLIAAVSNWWRPARLGVESIAELVSAVPATLVALLLVKILVKTDTSIVVVIGALLLTGWAGPYRVIRAELDRLGRMTFTQGAVALGVGRWRLFWRHHLPHLVPVIALNLSQQVVASLVLVAELGVLGAFVGATRLIIIDESLTRVITGQTNFALIADPPEWGGLLANARTVESLWTTRWLILVPGVAFAITALAIATTGFALARRYGRRDLTDDLRGRGAGAFASAMLVLFVVSALVPERYAPAHEWAAATRTEVRDATDIASAFTEAQLRPLASTYAVSREAGGVVQTGPAKVTVGATTITETFPLDPRRKLFSLQSQAFVSGETGGGAVEAPLVFVGRGITPSDFPPQPACPSIICGRPDIGRFIQEYADDYAQVDVRGKIAVVVRFFGIATKGRTPTLNDYAFGYPVQDSIAKAIAHGAVGVIFVDPDLHSYTDAPEPYVYSRTGGVNPYLRIGANSRPLTTSGVPVLVLDGGIAQTLFVPMGLDLSPFFDFDDADAARYKTSPGHALGPTARVEVPLERRSVQVTSYAGEVDVAHDEPRVLVWARREDGPDQPARDVIAAVARIAGARHAPLIFVDFDSSVDSAANAKVVRDLLGDRRIRLVVVLDKLRGGALSFSTPYGDLIPAFDLYAERSGARHEISRTTAEIGALAGIAPLIDVKTVVITGTGADGDLRPDAAGLLGYLAGRLALGAEELPR
jgi:peptide/nickel transport system permease protein